MEYTLLEERRGGICLECGDIIGYGRKDRKFCCDKCKNRYNNRKTTMNRRMIDRTHRILQKNYGILLNLVRAGVTRIAKIDLSMLGYDFNYVTSYYKYVSKDEFRCYDIRYYSGVDFIFRIEKLSLSLPAEKNKKEQ